MGYWGPPTANTNWCEEDYAYSFYIAEFWNTLSSLTLIAFGVYGICMHRGLIPTPSGKGRGLEWRFIVCLSLFSIVGIGSALFHGTLLRQWQLADELPMVWGNASFIYVCKAMRDPRGKDRVGLALGLVLTTVLVTIAILLRPGSQDLFLLAYGVSLVFIVYLNYTTMAHGPASGLLHLSLATYTLGFILWNIENVFCEQVRAYRFHALWHLFAGSGTYLLIVFWIYTRVTELQLKGEEPNIAGTHPLKFVVVKRVRSD